MKGGYVTDVELQAAIERAEVAHREQRFLGYNSQSTLSGDDIRDLDTLIKAAKRLRRVREVATDHLDYNTPALHTILNIIDGSEPEPRRNH